MNEILKDLSTTSLALSIEANLSSWMPVFGRIWQIIENDPPGIKRSISPVALPLFNSIMDSRLDPEAVEPAIQMVKADAEKRQVPVLWWVGPSTRPSDLGGTLEKHGFVIDDNSPGMAVILSDLKESLPISEGLSIQKVDSDELLERWCQTMAKGFELSDTKGDFLVESWRAFLRIVDRSITQAYLATLHGEPVATSLLQLGGGVAGIYAVSTIPEARRKGIGAQVTLHPLLEARDMGYRVGILGASEMGFPVYRSLGFQEYCRIRSYVYRL